MDSSSIGNGATSAFCKLRSIWISHLHYFFSQNGKTKMTKKMAKTKWPSLTQRFCARFFAPDFLPTFCARIFAHILRPNFCARFLRSHFAPDFLPTFLRPNFNTIFCAHIFYARILKQYIFPIESPHQLNRNESSNGFTYSVAFSENHGSVAFSENRKSMMSYHGKVPVE